MIRFITTVNPPVSQNMLFLLDPLHHTLLDLIKPRFISISRVWSVCILSQFLCHTFHIFLLYDLTTPLTVDEVIENVIITSYDVEMSAQMAKFQCFIKHHPEPFGLFELKASCEQFILKLKPFHRFNFSNS